MKSKTTTVVRTGYGYGRFSSKPQERGDSERRQREFIKSAGEKYQIKVLHVYFDEAVSGKAGLNLERQFGELLKVIQPGQVILVDSQERLGRQNAFVLTHLIYETVNKGVEFIFEDGSRINKENIDDLGTNVPTFLKAALGRLEIKERGRKIHQAHVGKMEKVFNDNKPFKHCGPCWVSFNDKTEEYTYDKDKADTIKDIFHLAIDKMGIMKIVQKLNQEKVPSISNRSNHWTFNGVHSLLRNKAVIGVYVSTDGREQPNHYKPIVDNDLFYRVQESLHSRSKGSGGGRPSKQPNLFKGLCRCSCGSNLMLAQRTIEKTGKTYTYLVCNKKRLGICKPYESIPFETFNDAFRLYFLSDPKTILSAFTETKQDKKSLAIQGELNTVETRLNGYRQDLEDGKVQLTTTLDTVLVNLEKKQKTLKTDLEQQKAKEIQDNQLPTLLKGYFKTTGNMFYVNTVPKVEWTNDKLKTFIECIKVDIGKNTFTVVLKDTKQTALVFTLTD